ncbi:MAG: Gfo/Idh/MocA family oxidoreductase [Clostridiales bacterium]|nr:Gfo/Idh/MocA family oxidoreductase [Clostridiales bacterium]
MKEDKRMINIALLSKWHVHAQGYAEEAVKSGHCRIVAVWDEKKERGEKWAQEHGAQFYEDVDEMLSRGDIDAVICCSPTTMHHELLLKVAKKGIHIFTEKALAPTVKECEELISVMKENGVKFIISMPQKSSASVKYAKKLLNEGRLGKISHLRLRNAHNGVSGNWLPDYWYDNSKTGGGAMMDLGCHPMYLSSYLLGKPLRVTSIMTQPLNSGMDESSTSTIEFEGGAVCVCETGFDAEGSPWMLELYGTKGCFIVVGGHMRYCSVDEGGKPEIIPEDEKSPIEKFVQWIDGGEEPKDMGFDDALTLTALLEASYISNEKNVTVEL